MVYTYSGILFSLKREGKPVCAITWMKGEVSQTQERPILHIYEVSKVVKNPRNGK